MTSKAGIAQILAVVFAVRGILGVFFLFSKSMGGVSNLGPGSGIITFMTSFLAVSAVIILASYHISKLTSWGWSLGMAATVVFLGSDILQTIITIPASPLEFLVDILLLVLLIVYRDNFGSQENRGEIPKPL